MPSGCSRSVKKSVLWQWSICGIPIHLITFHAEWRDLYQRGWTDQHHLPNIIHSRNTPVSNSIQRKAWGKESRLHTFTCRHECTQTWESTQSHSHSYWSSLLTRNQGTPHTSVFTLWWVTRSEPLKVKVNMKQKVPQCRSGTFNISLTTSSLHRCQRWKYCMYHEEDKKWVSDI